MSRARIWLAAASVLTGLAGAGAVLKAMDDGGETPDGATAVTTPPPPAAHTAPTATGQRIAVVHSRSRCTVDRTARTVVFRVVLRNSGNQDRAARLHPWVGLRDGGEISVTSYDRQVGLLAAEERAYTITVPYESRNNEPNRCRVSLGTRESSLAVRRVR